MTAKLPRRRRRKALAKLYYGIEEMGAHEERTVEAIAEREEARRKRDEALRLPDLAFMTDGKKSP